MYKRGEIVDVNLNPNIGNEQGKTRPCLIIESGASRLNLVLVLPITDKGSKQIGRSSNFVNIQEWSKVGLVKESVVDCYQIRAIDPRRIYRKRGAVGQEVVDEALAKLAIILEINESHLD